MTYKIVTTKDFDKEFSKLDRSVQKFIKAWISKHLTDCDDPRAMGRGLTSNRSGQWRYQIGDYRLLCEIRDAELVLVMIAIGHRRSVYDD